MLELKYTIKLYNQERVQNDNKFIRKWTYRVKELLPQMFFFLKIKKNKKNKRKKVFISVKSSFNPYQDLQINKLLFKEKQIFSLYQQQQQIINFKINKF